MSYRDIHIATDSLAAVLKDVLRLHDDEAGRVVEAVEELAKAMAEQEIDRLFNKRGFQTMTEFLTIAEALAYLRQRFVNVQVEYLHGEGGRVMGCTFKVDRSKHHVWGDKTDLPRLQLYADCVEYSRRKAEARLERKRRALVERERRAVAGWVAQARPDR